MPRASAFEKKRRENQEARKKLRVLEPAERDRTVNEWFDTVGAAGMSAKKLGNMRRAYELYTEMKALWTVAEKMGMVKSSIWKYFHEIEDQADVLIMPIQEKERPKQVGAVSRKKRKGSSRRASIRDFHSFRVTWITLALTAGVPLELVQRVTGHKTTDVVLKHYFKPGREDFRKSIEAAMPKMLVGAGEDAYEEKKGPGELLEMALAKLAGVQSRRYEGELGDAVDLILKAKEWIDGHLVREAGQ